MEQELSTKSTINLSVLWDDLLREMRRLRLWLPIMAVLLAVALTGYRYASYTPQYRATASFTIKVANPLQAEHSAYNIETAEQMAKTFPYILTSGVLQQRVREDLQVQRLPAIGAEALPNSSVFTLTVTDPDPQFAYAVLQSVIAHYPEVSDFVVGSTQMYLLSDGGTPTDPYNPFTPFKYALQGALIGLFLWLAHALLRALLKSTIHNDDELRQLLNVPCLTQLPVAKVIRKHPCPMLSMKQDPDGFCESVRLLRLRAEKLMQEENRKVLLVSSAIPGEGKTTVTANLAVALAGSGKKVLLIDWDLRSPSVARMLRLQHEDNGLADFLSGQLPARAVIHSTHVANLSVISGKKASRTIYQTTTAMDRATILIENVRREYDYVIIDTPPCSLLADATELAELADCAILVVRQDFASQEQILDAVQRLSDSRLATIGCVLNGTDSANSHSYGNGYGYGYGYGYAYGYGYGYGYGKEEASAEEEEN